MLAQGFFTPVRAVRLFMTTTITHSSLREQRLAVGLTQRELAAAAGCSLTFIANVEHGCVPRSSDVLPRIEAAIERAQVERELCTAA